MKLRPLILAVALMAVATVAVAAGKPGQDGVHDRVPTHGGVVASGKSVDMELVASPTILRLYLSRNGKPLDATHAKAKLTLIWGKKKRKVQLRPVNGVLETNGEFRVDEGTKVVAAVTIKGKSVGTAQFTL